MLKNTISRRDMLKAGAASVALASMPVSRLFAKEEEKKPMGVALQLYSVRNDCKDDFDATLQKVADLGFDAVEFAGYHNYSDDAEGLKKRLNDLGLKVAATHIGTASFGDDQLQKTIEFHEALGCKYLIVPWENRINKPDESKVLAEIFNKTAEALKPHGMQCGYHNHKHEFDTLDGKTYWDLFAERTSDDVVLQQDVGWTCAAKQDPVALIRKYPGRSQVIHCKPTVVDDPDAKPIIGEDSVPWAPIFVACEEVGGTEWLTIEQEAYLPGKSPMECVELSLAGLKKILG